MVEVLTSLDGKCSHVRLVSVQSLAHFMGCRLEVVQLLCRNEGKKVELDFGFRARWPHGDIVALIGQT